MSVSSPSRAIRIFFSYATSARQDKQLFDELTSHLILLRRQRLVDEWYTSELNVNHTPSKFVEAYLNTVDIIILLVSANFFASDLCYDFEMQRALERSNAGNVHLIPILLSPSEWETTPLHKYQALPTSGIPISDAPNRAAAFSEVAREIRLAVLNVSTQEKKVPTNSQHISAYNIPYPPNTLFTDRATILAQITSSFTTKKTRRTLVLALNGLSGIGKTQIALEYSYLSSDTYQAILWLNASSRAMLSTEISTLTDQFSLSDANSEDEQQLFTTFKRWLQDQPNWLLVLDQIVDLTLVDLIVPPQSNGHVLLTTDAQATRKRASPILVSSLPIDAAAQLLLQRASLLPSDVSLAQAPADIAQEAIAVAQALDGFPLAIDQAGAYIEEVGCSPAYYLARYQKQRANLLNQRGDSADSHPESVVRTLALAFEQVSLSNAINLELLHLLAFLHPDAIPEELLLDGAEELSEPLQSLVADPLLLHQALAALRSFSLIERGTESKMQRIHRIVQAVLSDSLTDDQKRYWAIQAVRLVNHVFPEVSFETWAECKRYLPQAQHCATLIDDYQLTVEAGAQLLERLGTYCYRRASYADAETYLTQALYLYEHDPQPNLPATAQTLNSLGLLRYQQAEYQQAEALHQRALAIREQALGPEHSLTAESLHNLALIYDELGSYPQAEQLYLRVLALEERAKGADDPDVATTLNMLALTYYQQGKYPQAEAMYQRALTIYEHTVSPEHPDHPELAYTLNGLGALAEKRGNYQRAEELYQRALTIRKNIFGAEHPAIAQSINRLARVAQAGGDYQQAEAFYKQALSMGEQALGPNHPDVALYLNNLALLAYKQAQYQQAEPLYQRALNIYEHAQGAKSAAVASILNNMGQLARKTRQEEQAETFLKRALLIRAELLGSAHPNTAQSLSNLADLLIDQHRYTEAEPMLQQALAMRRQILGPDHADTIDAQTRYAALLKHMNG